MLRNLTPEELLDHPRRAAIVDQVRAQPGLSFTDLRARIATLVGGSSPGYGSLLHHLYSLERAGVLTSRRSGRSRRYYPVGSPLGDPTAASVLQRPRTFQIARLVAHGRNVTSKQVATNLIGGNEPSKQALLYHMRLLKTAGLVTTLLNGRARTYAPTPRLVSLVAMLSRATAVPSPASQAFPPPRPASAAFPQPWLPHSAATMAHPSFANGAVRASPDVHGPVQDLQP